jgi:lipoprotein-releasing system permease protein
MYKYLLCLRYLRTRWIALASIISVMLGVWIMIVVNSVMEGFTSEMQNRIHGILSDVIFESRSMNGMRDAKWHEDQIRQIAGDDIEAMTATVVVPAMLYYQFGDNSIARPVNLIGIDETTHSNVSDFSKYLQHPENRKSMSFNLRESGYDIRDHQAATIAPARNQMTDAGWRWRRMAAQIQGFQSQFNKQDNKQTTPNPSQSSPAPSQSSSAANPGVAAPADLAANTATNTADNAATNTTAETTANSEAGKSGEAATSGNNMQQLPANPDPFANVNAGSAPDTSMFDPAKEQHTGAVLGIAMLSRRKKNGEDEFYALPGNDVILTTATAGDTPQFTRDYFTIVDYYESKMSENDSSFVFVPIRKLQEMRGMYERSTGVGWVNAIAIKVKPGVNIDTVRDKLQNAFNPAVYNICTWRDRQMAILNAVEMETAILNLLLFMIIAVAGFGILAIFYMIVVEKTRDIGVLKALGASKYGVMGIFLSYGLSLGLVGSGVGMTLGLLTSHNINKIAGWLAWITGRPVFDPSIYYFYKIPAVIIPGTVAWIVCGALAIAVLASILPARRAAKLHPVEALRYE